jgi:NTE family protein
MNPQFDQPISLALSGGGTRAMAYHLGVLKFLAERDLFERVTRISTVSGGSLLMGFIYKSAGFRWPRSKHFLDRTLPEIRDLLCQRNLQAEAFSQVLLPTNWGLALSRADLLALELKEHWGFDVPMSILPSGPEWSINGTNAQNGKRFRIKGGQIGDYDVGYADAPNFPLADALAVSAAFPVGIGPLRIRTADYVWKRRPFFGAAEGSDRVVKLPYEYLHLYDGGLYDNLGSESLFNLGEQTSKHPGDYIIISDAGAPLTYGMTWGPLSPERVKRMMDIMSDQQRALRVRSFVSYLRRCPTNGALIPIGTPVTGPGCPEAEFAKTFPTSLERFDRGDFDRLLQHGYDVATETHWHYGVYGLAAKPGGKAPRTVHVAPDGWSDCAAPDEVNDAATVPKAATSGVAGASIPGDRSDAPRPTHGLATGTAGLKSLHAGPEDLSAPQDETKPILVFDAVDVMLARMLRLGQWRAKPASSLDTGRAWWNRWGKELFSAAIAGFFIGLLLLALDHYVPDVVDGRGRFDRWAIGVAGEISSLLFAVSLLLLGLEPFLVWLPLLQRSSRFVRNAVARLAQDAAMFGLGVLSIMGIREVTMHLLPIGSGIAWGTATLMLLLVSGLMLIIREEAHRLIDRAALSVSGRAFCITLGLLFLYCSGPALLISVKNERHEQAKQSPGDDAQERMWTPSTVAPVPPTSSAPSSLH